MVSFVNRLVSAGRAFLLGRDPADDFWYHYLEGYMPSSSGIRVGPDSAMRATAVFSCINLRAGLQSLIPCHLYELISETERRNAREHNVYDMLRDEVNEFMSWQDFSMLMETWVLSRGNAYAYIERDRYNRPQSMTPIHPTLVTPKIENKKIVYHVRTEDGKEETLPQSSILHVKGISDDGILGLSPIAQAREAIGLALASERFGASFFGNGARPGVAIEVTAKMRSEDKVRFLDDWANRYSGKGAHRPAVLDPGMKVTPFGIPPEDAQFLETRQFQVEEICRVFGVPPHMAGATDRVSSWGTGIEQQFIGFKVTTLSVQCNRWASALRRSLLLPNERGKYYIEFMLDSLVAADIKSRNESLDIMRRNGIINANEWRAKMNMNPIGGAAGNDYWQPINFAPSGQNPKMDNTPAVTTGVVNEQNNGQ